MTLKKTIENAITDINDRIGCELSSKRISRRRMMTFINLLRDLNAAPEMQAPAEDIRINAIGTNIGAAMDAGVARGNVVVDIFNSCTSRSMAIRLLLYRRICTTASGAASIINDLEDVHGRALMRFSEGDDFVIDIMKKAGCKVQAIKDVREHFQVGLAEAKYRVDAVEYLSCFNWDNHAYAT